MWKKMIMEFQNEPIALWDTVFHTSSFHLSHLLFSSASAGFLRERYTWSSVSITRWQVPKGALHDFIGQPESARLQPESQQRWLAGTHQPGGIPTGAAIRLQPVSQSQHHGHLQLPGESDDSFLFHPPEPICTDTPRWSSGAAFSRGGLYILPTGGRQRSSAVSAGEQPVCLLIRRTEKKYSLSLDERICQMPECNEMLRRDLKDIYCIFKCKADIQNSLC